MIALFQIINKLFKDKESVVILVQTPLEEIHKENVALGCEFLDDFIRLDEDDIPDDETK
ncbi:hypothetical protein SAMN05518672_101805 [Chitinophaga sp. CF118]|uniref:hypothetical protein n=1 Tax=Chitinophaga sp. CF118 TaxID=1884367 RepID=UPI0008F17B8D|nr:hypothetical protein [Chitinophaga sp. CF118]SFD15998.1 hypothetical protein SAMN05518672_101805 [Chitinophaga sp. CF118]